VASPGRTGLHPPGGLGASLRPACRLRRPRRTLSLATLRTRRRAATAFEASLKAALGAVIGAGIRPACGWRASTRTAGRFFASGHGAGLSEKAYVVINGSRNDAHGPPRSLRSLPQ